MALIPFNFFARYVPGDPLDPAHNHLMYDQNGGAPAIPPLNAGDTIDCSVYFFDPGSGIVPYRNHRYAGATLEVRLRAQGNAHVYASGGTFGELAPATSIAVTHYQVGSAHATAEIQRVVFGSVPQTGKYRLVFPGPTVVGAPSGIVAPKGTTTDIAVGSSVATIAEAIRALPFYDVFNGTLQEASGWNKNLLTVTGTPDNFFINYLDATGTVNPGKGQIELCTVDASDVQFAFGWEALMALTAGDFTDLFLSANAPAYLEVLLNGVIAAQYQLTSSTGGGPGGGGIGGDPPPPPPGGGGAPTAVDGIVYDGDHFSTAWPVGVMRSETPFPEKPGYYIYHQRHRIARSSYADLPLDSVCPKDPNAFLVMETERQDVGGADLEEWDRVWANVPPQIVTYEVVNYPVQQLITISGNNTLQSYALTRLAKVTRTFYRTTAPESIPRNLLPRVMFIINNVPFSTPGFVNVTNGQTVIAADDAIDRWMGNIWVRTEKYVTI